jgi:hypothetical protein
MFGLKVVAFVVVADVVVIVDVCGGCVGYSVLLVFSVVTSLFCFLQFLLFDLSCKSQTFNCLTRITQILSEVSGPTIQRDKGEDLFIAIDK